MYRRGGIGHNGLIHELHRDRREVIPEVGRDVDRLWRGGAVKR